MIKLLLSLLVLLTLGACASAPPTNPAAPAPLSPADPIDLETGIRLKLPTTKKDDIVRSPFFNTQKSVLRADNGFVYEFYYGFGGRYLVQLQPPQGMYLDFNNTEVTLTVDAEGNSPEILSLSNDNQGLFSGIGKTRNGPIKYNLVVLVPSSRYNGEVKNQLKFEVQIKDTSDAGE